MKVVVLGLTGRVGREIVERLRIDGHGVRGLDRNAADFCSEADGPEDWILRHEPDIVINCVAFNGMEQCDLEPDLANLINSGKPRSIAKMCRSLGIPMIHFSSDYVFSGSHNQTPLLETFPVDPCGVYGQSKYAGELVVSYSDKNMVFRLSSIFGRRWEGPVDAVRQAVAGASHIRVLHQFCAPTSARTVANAIAQVLRVAAGRWEDYGGVYHLATTEGIWKKNYASELLSRVIGENSIEIVEGELEIPRPIHTFLCSDKFEETFSYKLPSWSEDLDVALPLMEAPVPA